MALVVVVIFSLFYMATPSTFVNATQFEWPSNPKAVKEKLTKTSFEGNQLVHAEGINLIKKHCLGCHSDQLIIQNRMSRERWEDNIQWMQETQGLWNLVMTTWVSSTIWRNIMPHFMWVGDTTLISHNWSGMSSKNRTKFTS